MVQEVSFNRNEVGIQNVGTVQPVGIDAQTAALEEAGAALERTRQISVQNAATAFENQAREEIFNTYNQYQADPDGLKKQLGQIKGKMAKGLGFGMGEIRNEMSAKFDLLAQGYEQKAIGNFQAMQNDKLAAGALETLTATQRDASNLAPLLLSSDPVVNSQATQSYAVMMDTVEKTLGQVGVDGLPLYSEVEKVKIRQGIADQTIFTAVEGAFNEAKTLGAKSEILRKFKSGELDIGLTMDLEGNAIKTNVRELMDYDKGSRLEEYMGKTIEAQRNKILAQNLATEKLKLENPVKAARMNGSNTLASIVDYQKGLGIADRNIRVLDNDEAKLMAKSLNMASSPAELEIALNEISTSYPAYVDNALNDLSRAGLNNDTRLALSLLDPDKYKSPDLETVDAFYNMSQMLDPSGKSISPQQAAKDKLTAQGSIEELSDIEARALQNMSEWLEISAASNADPAVISYTQQKVKDLAAYYIAEGMSTEDAASKASEWLTKGSIVQKINDYKFMLPATKFEEDNFYTTTAKDLLEDELSDLSIEGIYHEDITTETGMDADTYINSIKQSGGWVNSKDGKSLNLVDSMGIFVLDRDGKIINRSIDELKSKLEEREAEANQPSNAPPLNIIPKVIGDLEEEA